MNEAAPIEVSDQERVRTITINRPSALNAMNNAALASIRDTLAEAETDDRVAVVVLTANGRAFCAGSDLSEMQVRLEPGSAEHQFPSMLRQVARFEKPLVAAVNGLGVGIGMTILAHCDLVLMASSARLRAPFPQLGLAPEAGSSFTFASVMGWQNAAYALLSGRWFSAAECLDMGLVWRVCEPDALRTETDAVAAEIAANPIPSLVATKKLMLDAGRRDQAIAAHLRELEAFKPLLGGPANAEAIAAFVEKREPDFRNIPGI
ncbi:MAG: enoyl-CoA hydratase/isomerase family protein [Chromatiales bacterium]|nr:enoyl-CoA hydratase/isomerase family protein [Chromatiales bacterium]